MARPSQPSQPRRTPGWLRGARYAFVALILFLVLFGYQTASLYTDWQWFNELGKAGVFSTTLGAKVTLFLGFGLLFFVVVYFNLWLAQRLNAGRPRVRYLDPQREQIAELAHKTTQFGSLVGAVVLAFLVGLNAASRWSDYLLFTHAGTFGQADPVFGKDVGFYVFRLPFLSYLQNWFLFTLVVAAIGAAAVHASHRAIDFVSGSVPTLEGYVRRHVLGLLGVIALVFAVGLYLSRFNLLYSDNGAFYGAGYTDVHARLPALTLQVFIMAVVGVLCFVNINLGRPFRLPIGGLVVWALVALLGSGVIPGMLQRFTVVPNQFGKEREYIARDIEFTRKAYGLDKIVEQPFPASTALTAADLSANRTTIENIRLWDWPQLGSVYTAKQGLRQYYRFELPAGTSTTAGDYNIDVDRYQIRGQFRQVMLAPRELYPEGLPQQAQTWQNRKLQYTHGYGAVMSPVNRMDSDGLPEYLLSEIPVRSSVPELKVERPELYYGELARDYVFVDSKQLEFDYPAGNGNKETKYAGKGGVKLGGTLSRLAWSVRLGDTNMLLSGDLADESRILFRRNIRERVATLAPFLQWDNDPYLVVDNGRFVWVMDAFTVTDRYPYSKPFGAGMGPSDTEDFNYIRNSVKAVVDAYDGTVTLYVSDENDPLIQTWQRIFPGLLTPFAQMPASLRAHVRYPEDLFRIQRDIYSVYHITDPRVYYGKEDVWQVPVDPTVSTVDHPQRMMPYYVNIRLPGAAREEFMMITPFTPLDKQNMAAWMCAKCDPEDYGQILLYRFPRGSNVNGPQQIISQIKSQPEISREMTLLGQQGSKVIMGNILAIPMNSSLLYVVPLYIQASGSDQTTIPQLRQVIAASGDIIVMRPTLDSAIAALGQGTGTVVAGGNVTTPSGTGAGTRPSGAVNTATPGPAPTARPGTVAELLRRANAAYDRARRTQQEYNRSLDELGAALKELERGMGAAPR